MKWFTFFLGGSFKPDLSEIYIRRSVPVKGGMFTDVVISASLLSKTIYAYSDLTAA
jgi:hypothetical protein